MKYKLYTQLEFKKYKLYTRLEFKQYRQYTLQCSTRGLKTKTTNSRTTGNFADTSHRFGKEDVKYLEYKNSTGVLQT